MKTNGAMSRVRPMVRITVFRRKDGLFVGSLYMNSAARSELRAKGWPEDFRASLRTMVRGGKTFFVMRQHHEGRWVRNGGPGVGLSVQVFGVPQRAGVPRHVADLEIDEEKIVFVAPAWASRTGAKERKKAA